MGSGASKLKESLVTSSVQELKECLQNLDQEQRKAFISAAQKVEHPHSCGNMPKIPDCLWQLWPTLGERFGPYNFLFAQDPTEQIRAKLGSEKFVDPEYQELKSALHDAYRLADDPKAECVWPEEGPQLHHVKQVSLGDCEFMASFAAMSMYPERMKEVFSNVQGGKLDPNGLYTFKVTYHGRVGWIVIDDLVPGCPGQPEGAYPAHGTIWVSLLEKLTAKLSDTEYMLLDGHGGRYDAGLEYKTGMDIISLLFGGHTLSVYPPKSKDLCFCELIDFLIKEPGTVVTCGGHGGEGIVDHHAYAIGGMYTVGDIQLVKMQNPWGFGEWHGDWSDKSPLWAEHPEVAEAVSFKAEDDGCFFISYQDFITRFSAFLFNRITPSREAEDDATAEYDEWLGEYSDGTINSQFKKTPEGGLWLDHEGHGPFDYIRSKYQYELNVKPPLGPGTAFLVKRPDGSVLGYSAGLHDWNWYVGPVKADPTEGAIEIKHRNWKPRIREWDAGEKAMHWVGQWTADDGEVLTVTGDTFDTLTITYNGKSYKIAPIMFPGFVVTVPHDYTAMVNVNKVQRFRRHIQLSFLTRDPKCFNYSGDHKYWTPEEE